MRALGAPLHCGHYAIGVALRPGKPGDDFFRYVNGAWLDRAVIPADKTAVTRRLEMTDRTEERLHQILEASAAGAGHHPRDVNGKVAAFYLRCSGRNRPQPFRAFSATRS
jgi:predicted metalloendopeptidase